MSVQAQREKQQIKLVYVGSGRGNMRFQAGTAMQKKKYPRLVNLVENLVRVEILQIKLQPQ